VDHGAKADLARGREECKLRRCCEGGVSLVDPPPCMREGRNKLTAAGIARRVIVMQEKMQRINVQSIYGGDEETCWRCEVMYAAELKLFQPNLLFP